MKHLEELQEIDKGIRKLEKEADFPPTEIARMEEGLQETETVVNEAKEKLTASEAEKRDKDDELSVNTERMELFKGRLRSLKTNAEYQASLKEIDQASKRNSEIEDEVLELMERLEEETKTLSDAEAAYNENKTDFEKEKEDLLKNLEETKKTLKTTVKERTTKLKNLDPEISKLYEGLSAKLKGVVLATAENGICTGCHLHLPPQLLNDAMRHEKLYQCPNCYRILAVETP